MVGWFSSEVWAALAGAAAGSMLTALVSVILFIAQARSASRQKKQEYVGHVMVLVTKLTSRYLPDSPEELRQRDKYFADIRAESARAFEFDPKWAQLLHNAINVLWRYKGLLDSFALGTIGRETLEDFRVRATNIMLNALEIRVSEQSGEVRRTSLEDEMRRYGHEAADRAQP